jgi:hypothetical protein
LHVAQRAQASWIDRLQPYSFASRGKRILMPAQHVKRPRSVVVSRGVRGLQRHRPIQLLDGLARLACVHQGKPEVAPDTGVLGI